MAVGVGELVPRAGETAAISVEEGATVGIGVGGMGVAEGGAVIMPSLLMLNLVGEGKERRST